MILTREEAKKKGFEAILKMLDTEREITLISEEGEKYYEEMYDKALQNYKDGKTIPITDIKKHVNDAWDN